MSKSFHEEIAKALEDNPDGLTAYSMAKLTGLPPGSLYKSLKAFRGAYVDRWVLGGNHRWTAVWAGHKGLGPTPLDCPKPERSLKWPN